MTSPPATAGAGLTGATASGSATPARSASPSALASSSAPPPPVGDACLIGTWRDNGYTQTATSDGSTVSIHGGAGNLDYIAASGVDDNIYGAGTAPFYGTLEGHPLTVTYKGTKILLLRANPGTHTVIVTYKGWTSGSTIAGEVEGRTASDPLTKSADQVSTEGYSCSATTLTWTLAGKVTDTEKRVSEKS